MIKWKDGTTQKCDGTTDPLSRHELLEITTLEDCLNKVFLCRWCGVHIKEILKNDGSSDYYFC